jgi:hypothetical protein
MSPIYYYKKNTHQYRYMATEDINIWYDTTTKRSVSTQSPSIETSKFNEKPGHKSHRGDRPPLDPLLLAQLVGPRPTLSDQAVGS